MQASDTTVGLLIQEPAGVLHQVSGEIDIFDYKRMKEAKLLSQKMCGVAWPLRGLGLAAPQVGVLTRMFIFLEGDNPRYTTCINPSFEPLGDEMVTTDEGCLSVEGGKKYIPVERHKEVRATWFDLRGNRLIKTLRGEDSIVFQHEYDHLEGRTILGDEYLDVQSGEVPVGDEGHVPVLTLVEDAVTDR